MSLRRKMWPRRRPKSPARRWDSTHQSKCVCEHVWCISVCVIFLICFLFVQVIFVKTHKFISQQGQCFYASHLDVFFIIIICLLFKCTRQSTSLLTAEPWWGHFHGPVLQELPPLQEEDVWQHVGPSQEARSGASPRCRRRHCFTITLLPGGLTLPLLVSDQNWLRWIRRTYQVHSACILDFLLQGHLVYIK